MIYPETTQREANKLTNTTSRSQWPRLLMFYSVVVILMYSIYHFLLMIYHNNNCSQSIVEVLYLGMV